jgi:phosphoribosylanthranilate isomerase
MTLRVKVCGLREALRVEQACALGAAFTGFIFYPPAPRSLEPAAAASLVDHVAPGVQTVGVFVDPTDAWLDAVLAAVPLDILQLHGEESPERVADIARRTGRRVMKAIRVQGVDDLARIPGYAAVADMLLFDAKPPQDAAWPGGHGLPFDWRLLQNIDPGRPWALAGGLTATSLEAAVDLVHPPIVDVSTGVEERPGVKDPAKLEAFLLEASRLGARTLSAANGAS